MNDPPNDNDQPYFATPTNKSNTYYPQQEPLPPPQPEKKANGCLIVTVVVVAIILALVICGAIGTAFSNRTASTPAPDATQSAGQTQSIPDQLQTALPSLQSDWIFTESDGNVVLSLHVSDTITVDTTLKAKNLIITEEQHVWQAGVAGIHLVTISVAGTDANGGAQDVAKATVLESTASALHWDSLTPVQAWSQFDKTWTIDDGTPEYGN